ncbi:MAG: tetratricopeptide repeat protein [Phycisphaerae bacterium]
MTIQQVFDLALQYHRAGRLQEAEQTYRQILAQQPRNAEVLHQLGVLAAQTGRIDVAVDLIRQAIALEPDYAEAHCNLGNVLKEKGRLDEAIAAYRHAIGLKPNYPAAHNNLGNALKDQGQPDEAIAAYRQAIVLNPNYPLAQNNLGTALLETGHPDEAIASFQQAIALNPNYANAYSNLGNALRTKGLLGEAITACKQAISLNPNLPDAHNNLGNALRDHKHLDEAIVAYRRAIALKANYPGAYYNLGNVLGDKGRMDDAIAAFRQAIALKPDYFEAHHFLGKVIQEKGRLDEAIIAFRQAISLESKYAEAYSSLGNALRNKGQLDEAVAAYRHAIALKPNFPEAHSDLGVALSDAGQLDEAILAFRTTIQLNSEVVTADSNLVYTLHFHPDYDAQALYREHRRWNQQHAHPLATVIESHSNNRSPDRRLKIGYVSPDFRDQAESFFTIPLFENHDHTGVEIFCYSSVIKSDRITERLRKCADVWRDVRNESDEALAHIIRQDHVDILIDLTMHMANNRALLFARKPAPVQVCWLAYPGGTGLETMDYRLTDFFMDPVDDDRSCYFEESIRLPDCWVVYDPLIDLSPRPSEQTGPITFGSLNNPIKLNTPLLTLWARVLQATPDARLILLVQSTEHRQRIGRLMESLGIATDRLEFVGRMNRLQYLRSHDRIDIALDPLPYNGITTTCDALYMGTPVLTLPGQTAAGRAGKAMLSTIGLSELVAHNSDEFVRKAAQLAADLPRLIEIRRGLRARLAGSPLMDAPRFARNVEAAYRAMWRRWCEKTGSQAQV